MKEDFSEKRSSHFVKLLPCNTEKLVDFNLSNTELSNLMTSSNKNSTIQPHHIVLNNVNTCNAITINTSSIQNNNNNAVPTSAPQNLLNAAALTMGGESRSPSLQQEPLKSPATSSSNSGGGEPKVIYTNIPFASLGKTVTPILPNNLQQQQQGATTLSGIKTSTVGTASFISIQDLKSYPNIITTVVDSSTLQQQHQTQSKLVCSTSSAGAVLTTVPQTSLAIPLRQGMRLVPHGAGIATSAGGGTIQATLKRNPNSDLENPIITKVIITNTSKSSSDVGGFNHQQEGSKTVTATLACQKPTGTFLLASPSKPLTNTGGEGSSSGAATLTLNTPIVVKSFQSSANASKKILLKPSPGLFNLNKLSPEKKGELASLAAGGKVQCIKLVTSTPTKCNSDGSKPMMIGKVKPITELSSSGNLPQPTVVSLQKQICQVSKPGQRFLIPAPALRQPTSMAGQLQQQQQPQTAMIRTVESNLLTFSPQTAQALQNIVMVPTQYLSTAGAGNTGHMVIQSLAAASATAPNHGTAQPAAVKKVVSIQPKYPPGYQPQPIAPHTTSSSLPPQQSQSQTQQSHQTFTNGVSSEATNPNDPRPRKPCNCTKSQCLKLYCDCFANGEFCNLCNCTNCYNNLEHEEERQKAIKACLDRNPLAFHPKIGKSKNGDHERRHTKGCNCKRSGCLKNYCECYEAKILCTNLCKCVGCKNFEDSCERKTLMHLADAAEVRVQQQAAAKTKLTPHMPLRPPALSGSSGERLPFALITDEVIEATSQCLLAQAEDGEKSDLPVSTVERLILEEFGRCLMQIIDCSNKTKN